MNLPTSLKLTWIFTLALAVKLLPEPGSEGHEIADNRILSTNPRGAPEPNVTWKEPGMKFTHIYIYIHMYIHIHYTQDIHIHPCIDYSIHIATGVKCETPAPSPDPPGCSGHRDRIRRRRGTPGWQCCLPQQPGLWRLGAGQKTLKNAGLNGRCACLMGDVHGDFLLNHDIFMVI